MSIGTVPEKYADGGSLYLNGVSSALKRSGRGLLYLGPSRWGGRQIAVVVSGRSKNGKTGDVAQITVIPLDVGRPMDGVKSDTNTSVCGGCPKQDSGECYTHSAVVPRGVNSMYRALRQTVTSVLGNRSDHLPGCVGTYPDLRHATPDVLSGIFKGRTVRLMQYGDSGAIPRWAYERIAEAIRVSQGYGRRLNILAYTHAWKDQIRGGVRYDSAPWLKHTHMASVSSVEEAEEAGSLGWRTFRDTTSLDAGVNEIYCPATPEGGSKVKCDSCGLCGGNTLKARSIVLLDHGENARRDKRTHEALVQIAG